MPSMNREKQMKYIIVIGDGMADYPIPELGNRTPLQAAYKPNMDKIAAEGRNGIIRTVPDTLNPGSDVAILSVLGFDPTLFYTGRGAFEAAARGIKLRDSDVAFRCNLITEKDGILTDYSSGHITSKESTQLITVIKTACEKKGQIEFYPGLDYRHFLIIRNSPFSLQVECAPPHDVIGKKIANVLPKANSPEAEMVATLLRGFIHKSKELLEMHPVNVARRKIGKNPGNMIWPWGGGKKPRIPTFKRKYGLDSAVISAVDLVKGIGIYAGMKIIEVPGATGREDTDYEGKANCALKALEDNDLVFVHVEAPDEAGHIKDYHLKVKTIEDLDNKLLGKILEHLGEPYAIAVLPDHPTPIKIGTHTREPVPFAVYSPQLKKDEVQKFDEISAKKGGFGLVNHGGVVSLLLSDNRMSNQPKF